MSVRLDQLSNGMRVVSQNMPHVETVSLGVWVKAGSRTEDEHEHGISHFLEHMAFKGTPTRTAREVVEGIEDKGGYLNAATSFDTTYYYARVLKEDTDTALDILADILQNPLFSSADIDRESEVILQEIAASQDSPDDVVFDLAQQAAFSNHALGRPILGTEQSVAGFDASMLRTYMDKHYTAANMVVSAAGAINHDDLLKKSGEIFSSLNRDSGVRSSKADYQGGIKQADRHFEQSHIIVAFEGLPYVHEDYYAKQVFSALFGGGMSSRLFQEAREERGLCYSIDTYSWGLADTGLFGIHSATSPEHLSELSDVIVNELKKIAQDGPDETELARSKAQLKAGLLMSLESTGSRAEQLARQVLAFGEPRTTEELIARVDGVTTDQVRNLIGSIMTNSTPSCSGVGSFSGFKGYDWLCNQFKS